MLTHCTVLGWLAFGILASPNHDELQARAPLHRAPQQYDSAVQTSRRLDSVGGDTCETVHTRSFESIRIGYEFVDADSVSQAIKDHISNEIMDRAVGYWQQALKVHRATAPLRANRLASQCTKYDHETTWTCQSASAPTCGTDGVTIPEKFLSNQLGSGYQMCSECTLANGAGADGVDFYIFVVVKDSSSCGGATQAYATACVQDQCDRPIFASVTFCLSKVSLDPAETDAQVSTAVHEIAHALAFSSRLFKYFRNADGTPKLTREANDDSKVQGTVLWSCEVGASYTYPDSNSGTRDHVDLQAKGLVTTVDERGIGTCPCPLGKSSMSSGCLVPQEPSFRTPSCVVKMVTPKVVEKVREHFHCDSLVGAELENQATTSCTIIGSHWEQRIFMGEVMAAVHSGVRPLFLSAVTLALFEDSGWYQPDYSFADKLVSNVHWGYQQGCSFATGPCVTSGSTNFERFWCSSESASICSWDRRGVQQCSTDSYSNSLPSAVGSYYSTDTTGSLAEADYCPFYATSITNRNCTDSQSIFLPYSNVNYMREVFGSTSRCLESTLHYDVSSGGGTYKATSSDFASARPACYEVICAADESEYEVRLSDLSGSTVSLGRCTKAGQALISMDLMGDLKCAAPAELCSVVPSRLSIASGLNPAPAPSGSSGSGDGWMLISAAVRHGHCGFFRWTLALLAVGFADASRTLTRSG